MSFIPSRKFLRQSHNSDRRITREGSIPPCRSDIVSSLSPLLSSFDHLTYRERTVPCHRQKWPSISIWVRTSKSLNDKIIINDDDLLAISRLDLNIFISQYYDCSTSEHMMEFRYWLYYNFNRLGFVFYVAFDHLHPDIIYSNFSQDVPWNWISSLVFSLSFHFTSFQQKKSRINHSIQWTIKSTHFSQCKHIRKLLSWVERYRTVWSNSNIKFSLPPALSVEWKLFLTRAILHLQ